MLSTAGMLFDTAQVLFAEWNESCITTPVKSTIRTKRNQEDSHIDMVVWHLRTLKKLQISSPRRRFFSLSLRALWINMRRKNCTTHCLWNLPDRHPSTTASTHYPLLCVIFAVNRRYICQQELPLADWRYDGKSKLVPILCQAVKTTSEQQLMTMDVLLNCTMKPVHWKNEFSNTSRSKFICQSIIFNWFQTFWQMYLRGSSQGMSSHSVLSLSNDPIAMQFCDSWNSGLMLPQWLYWTTSLFVVIQIHLPSRPMSVPASQNVSLPRFDMLNSSLSSRLSSVDVTEASWSP